MAQHSSRMERSMYAVKVVEVKEMWFAFLQSPLSEAGIVSSVANQKAGFAISER